MLQHFKRIFLPLIFLLPVIIGLNSCSQNDKQSYDKLSQLRLRKYVHHQDAKKLAENGNPSLKTRLAPLPAKIVFVRKNDANTYRIRYTYWENGRQHTSGPVKGRSSSAIGLPL